MNLRGDEKPTQEDRSGGAQNAGGQGDDAGAKLSEPAAGDEEPASAGKFKERPGPEEVAKLRHERKRRELMERIEELKKAGFGDVHPHVKSVAQELEKLGEGEGVEAGR
jgi:hypothetical protein